MSTVLTNTITAVGGGGSTVKDANDATYVSEGTVTVKHKTLCKGSDKHWIGNLDMSDGYWLLTVSILLLLQMLMAILM